MHGEQAGCDIMRASSCVSAGSPHLSASAAGGASQARDHGRYASMLQLFGSLYIILKRHTASRTLWHQADPPWIAGRAGYGAQLDRLHVSLQQHTVFRKKADLHCLLCCITLCARYEKRRPVHLQHLQPMMHGARHSMPWSKSALCGRDTPTHASEAGQAQARASSPR